MKYLIYISLGIISLSSCTKIIDVELNEGLQRIVIEGRITDQDEPVSVYITRTTDYFNPLDPENVTGATVSIKAESGVFVTLTELGEGHYETSMIKGENGKRYYLRVEDGEEVYEASSYLPKKVFMDSLVYAPSFFVNPQDTLLGFLLTCWFTDPAEQTNYYNFALKRTPEPIVDEEEERRGPPSSGNSAILLNDINFNGRLSSFNLNRLGLYYINDTIDVQMISIDQPIYEYYDQLAAITGGGIMFSSSAPANPMNNFSNGALGYFSAEAIDKKRVIIRPF